MFVMFTILKTTEHITSAQFGIKKLYRCLKIKNSNYACVGATHIMQQVLDVLQPFHHLGGVPQLLHHAVLITTLLDQRDGSDQLPEVTVVDGQEQVWEVRCFVLENDTPSLAL